MKPMTDIKDVTEQLVRSFTRHHDHLKLDWSETNQSLGLSIKSHADDTPKCIGQGGIMCKALRMLLEAMSERKVLLIVEQPTVGEHHPSKFVPNMLYMPTGEAKLLAKLGNTLFEGSATATVVQRGNNTHTLVLTIDGQRNDFDMEIAEAVETVFLAIGKCRGINLFTELEAQ